MLEQPTLLLRPRPATGISLSGTVAVVDPVTAGPLGSAGIALSPRRGWFPWPSRPAVEVREDDDEPLVFTIRRRWWPWPSWQVLDAEGNVVGRVRGTHLLDSRGRHFADLRPGDETNTVLYLDYQHRELARMECDDDVKLVFLPDAQGNPFLKMLLLAAALVHNQTVLGKL